VYGGAVGRAEISLDATSADPLATPDELRRYAEAIAIGCLGLSEGDVLFVEAAPQHQELVVALAQAAFALGADVDVEYEDALVDRARIQHAREELLGSVPAFEQRRLRAQVGPRAALAVILSEAHPDALAGIAPERIATAYGRRQRALRWYITATRDFRVHWTIALWPTPGWARQVYPELGERDAMRRLLDDLLRFCRLGPDDPPDAWSRHLDRLARRADALTALDLRSLELRGPGTSLDLRLVPGTRFASGMVDSAYGRRICVNFPTEEVFTSPDAAGTEGTFRCTKPLAYRGRTITGLSGSFRRGRLERLEADEEDARDVLAAALDSDRGSRRLGEVAFVDASSRIGETGRTYANTGLDENVASHIAFGAGFPFTRVPDESARGSRGVNRAAVHVDVMIGAPELEVAGVTASGRRVALIAGGLWQI
jgi:aminopeptidase